MTPLEYIALDLYLGCFAARHDAYVKDSRAHIDSPLTPEVARAAFVGQGAFSVSGYLAVKRGDIFMTHVGAIDFDLEDGFERAKGVRAFLDEHDIQSLLVGSRRGAHLWVLTTGDGEGSSEPFGMVPARVMRRALEAAVLLTGSGESIEVFPKRSDKDWGVGALRMPLQRHPKTGVRYPAYDPFDDREVTNLIPLVNLMADLQQGTRYNALRRLAGADPAPVPYPTHSGRERPSYRPQGPMPLITDLLMSHFGLTVTPGHSVRCPFHDDQKASLSVSPDDERCWCKAPSCIAHNDGRGLGSISLAEHLRKEQQLGPHHQ